MNSVLKGSVMIGKAASQDFCQLHASCIMHLLKSLSRSKEESNGEEDILGRLTASISRYSLCSSLLPLSSINSSETSLQRSFFLSFGQTCVSLIPVVEQLGRDRGRCRDTYHMIRKLNH